jgi:hypothetical protein
MTQEKLIELLKNLSMFSIRNIDTIESNAKVGMKSNDEVVFHYWVRT